MKWETDVSGIDLCNRWFKSFISASTDKTSLRFCRYTCILAPDFSTQPTCVFPRLTPLPSRQWSLVIYSLPDCRIFPSSYCRIVVFYRIVVFPSSFHRPFSLRFIFVLLLDCRFYQIVVFPYVILPDCRFYPIVVFPFVILPDCRSFYRIDVVSFVLLPLFPSSYY